MPPCCRGLARFSADDLPVPLDTIRQMFGAGVRAGMYPVTAQGDLYWFICFNADEVSLVHTVGGA